MSTLSLPGGDSILAVGAAALPPILDEPPWKVEVKERGEGKEMGHRVSGAHALIPATFQTS